MRVYEYHEPDARQANPVQCCGRRLMFKGGGGSSSSATTTTQTQDNRMVVDHGVGISASNSTVNVQSLDADAIKAALDFATGADATVGAGFTALLNSADKNTFAVGDSFKSLLSSADKNTFAVGDSFKTLTTLADKLFTTGANILQSTADTTLAQVSALSAAQADAKGAMDQKTMVLLAGAAAVAFVMRNK